MEFSCNELIDGIKADMELIGIIEDYLALVDRCLTFLHDQKIITLQNGLAVFRQAMRINLLPQKQNRRYNKGDYQPLSHHYQERIFQIHVMGEYARLGMEKFKQALKLVLDYFTIDKKSFFQKYFAGRETELMNPTLAETYRKIVEDLKNPRQQAIVTSNLDENSLILAGPGSGKTRVIVHRCAYLLSVERVNPSSILILCFNHNAAVALKRRLSDLVGKDAKRVTVLTYHSLAMKLAGRSFAGDSNRFRTDDIDFDGIIRDAVDLLNGEIQIPGIEADDQRDSLLAGYQFILIDEYQDIDQVQYDLISAIAGRRLSDVEEKINLMAVGDDDQNIYSFRGANVKYIRKFQEDYRIRKPNKKTAGVEAVKLYHLVENYRSSRHIIDAANALIANNRDRMKSGFPIQIDEKRKEDAPGGDWTKRDPIAGGKAQVLEVVEPVDQAVTIIDEVERLKGLDPGLDWSDFAVLSRVKADLPALRAYCEKKEIPITWTLNKESSPPLHRIREIESFLVRLKQNPKEIKSGSELLDDFLADETETPRNIWSRLTIDILEDHTLNTQDSRLPVQYVIDYLYETLGEYQKEYKIGNGIFLSTVHSAKGMEFPHVFITGGGWNYSGNNTNQEEERRLFYVAMTRAKQTLSLVRIKSSFHPHLNLLQGDFLTTRTPECKIKQRAEELDLNYELIGLRDLFLGFPRGYADGSDIHRHLARLRRGDFVSFKVSGSEIFVLNPDQNVVAKLSKSACIQWREKIPRIKKASVFAIIKRYREDEEKEYRHFIKTESWELPLIEVVWH
ncbi:MAG: ATP-dependent helicase [Proteobacteria bacterium]|nr:ATP-dependent helicase [Pseudomonadota bacterium]